MTRRNSCQGRRAMLTLIASSVQRSRLPICEKRSTTAIAVIPARINAVRVRSPILFSVVEVLWQTNGPSGAGALMCRVDDELITPALLRRHKECAATLDGGSEVVDHAHKSVTVIEPLAFQELSVSAKL